MHLPFLLLLRQSSKSLFVFSCRSRVLKELPCWHQGQNQFPHARDQSHHSCSRSCALNWQHKLSPRDFNFTFVANQVTPHRQSYLVERSDWPIIPDDHTKDSLMRGSRIFSTRKTKQTRAKWSRYGRLSVGIRRSRREPAPWCIALSLDQRIYCMLRCCPSLRSIAMALCVLLSHRTERSSSFHALLPVVCFVTHRRRLLP